MIIENITIIQMIFFTLFIVTLHKIFIILIIAGPVICPTGKDMNHEGHHYGLFGYLPSVAGKWDDLQFRGQHQRSP